MAYRNTIISYGSVSKFIHWLIFLFVSGMLIVGFLMGDVGDKALRAQVYNLHKLTGLTILLIMLFRVVWVLKNPRPKFPDIMAQWQRLSARSVHIALYLFLIVMPLTGWIMSSAAGRYPNFFGLFPIPLPIPKDKAIADLFAEIHEITAFIIIALVSIHILAALKHHFYDKDNVLKRMLPKRKVRP